MVNGEQIPASAWRSANRQTLPSQDRRRAASIAIEDHPKLCYALAGTRSDSHGFSAGEECRRARQPPRPRKAEPRFLTHEQVHDHAEACGRSGLAEPGFEAPAPIRLRPQLPARAALRWWWLTQADWCD
jgi:hypothetical protein